MLNFAGVLQTLLDQTGILVEFTGRQYRTKVLLADIDQVDIFFLDLSNFRSIWAKTGSISMTESLKPMNLIRKLLNIEIWRST